MRVDIYFFSREEGAPVNLHNICVYMALENYTDAGITAAV